MNPQPFPMTAWALPTVILLVIEYVIALVIGARVGFHYSIPLAAYMIVALAFVGLAAAATVVVRLAIYAAHKEDHPTRRLMREAHHFSGFAVGVVLVAAQTAVLTWMKVMLPIASPFWADPLLANVDHAIFGRDPWVLTHQLFGWAGAFVDRTYVTWAPVKFATLAIILAMPESERKARALLSDFLIVGSVVVGQFLLPSAGPVFYARFGFGDRFSALPIEPWVETARTYLWQDYLRAGGDIGGGISAMPSFHVAAALWLALVWNSYDRRLGVIGFVYFATILVGSVFLGWHYAADGIAGILITGLAWFTAPRIVNWSTRRIARPALEPA
jgi:hypothetical protein